MTFRASRAFAVLAAIGLLVLTSFLQPTVAQQVIQIGGKRGFVQPDQVFPPTTGPATGTGDPSDLSGITLVTDEKYAKKFNDVYDHMKNETWPEAVAVLQELIDIPDDVFTPITKKVEGGKTTRTIVSVRVEAARLISELPPKGLDYYKVTYGPQAAAMLKSAGEGNDPKKVLAEIMRRYLYTDAGIEATQLLATHLLDRGQYSAAGLCYERLIQRVGPERVLPIHLFKAAIAFRYTGDTTRLEAVWRQLEAKTDKLVLGEKPMAVAELKNYVTGRRSAGYSKTRYDWVMVGGDPTRGAQGDGGTAFLDPIFTHPTVTENETKGYIRSALEQIDSVKGSTLPPFSPVATTVNTGDVKVPLMVHRSFWGIHARIVKAVRVDGTDYKAGEVFWEAPSAWSVDRMLREPKHVGALKQWLGIYLTNRTRPSILFDNSTVGSLSTDNARVYMVDDFMVPPFSPQVNPGFPGQPGVPGGGGPLGEAINHNRLQAYELDSGKLLWEIGGKDDKHPLGNSYFLGPPLPLNGKLFVLNERDQELRLVTLEPATGGIAGKPQRLADTRDKMTADMNRRINAAHLAYGEGILVCPTNSGGLLGVDLLTNSLVWAYGYREKGYTAAPQYNPAMGGQPGMVMLPDGRWVHAAATAPNWHATPPIIVGGKVVFTAPDAGAVHCLNLRDGACLWKNARQEGDQYVAGVYDGKVLVVGKGYARALDVKDNGKEVWRVETGSPSGIGIASKDLYYLPLKEATKSREPEICIIDMTKGLVAAHTRSRKKEVPGSLLFYDGMVLSQGLQHVAAYPQLDVELKNIDSLLAANPKDAVGLTKRGDLRLDKGDLAGAIVDLRMALANLPPNPPEGLVPKAREKLYESLTEYFQRDFDKAEATDGYLKEYEAMCSVVTPQLAGVERQKALAEEKKRKGNFYCLVGKGKEAQGLKADSGPDGQKKLVEAFEAYMNFGALGEIDQEMMSVVDDPGVRASPMVWARGRIAAMVSGAGKDKRGPLEAVIAQRWNKVKAAGDAESLRNFANTFGDISNVGREARLQLADKLIADGDPKTLLEAERQLHLLRTQADDRSMAGRAVEAMARLMTARGLMEDAAYFYRVLANDHAKTVIKDGKTGQDFYNDLATDKRFLPYLDEPASLFGVRMTAENVKEQDGNFPYYANQWLLEHLGEKLPYFQQFKFAMRTDYHQLKLFDRDAGTEVWSQNLTQTHFQNLVRNYNAQQQSPRFGFQNVGHLVVLQLGHMVFALDPVNKQVLWEKNLSRSSTSLPVYQRHTVDQKDGSSQVFYADGWTQRLGNTGPVSAIAVVLPTHDALVAVDPVTGKELWTRADMPKKCHIYNDDRHVYVIEVGNDGTTAGATRVFRLQDGVNVPVNDFGELYQRRTAIKGRTLVVADTDAQGTTLRLYDILTGQDRWKQQFKTGSQVLQSENASLGGVVEPGGTATVVDFGLDRAIPVEPKVLFTAQMKPEHLARVSSLHLLRDQKDIYIACNGQADQQILNGSMMSNILPYTGLRVLPINGELYSFDGKTGEMNWHNSCANQMVVLEEFHSLPMAVLTSRYRKWINQVQGQHTYVMATRAYDKKTGKLIFDRESSDGRYQQFHSIRVDGRAGRFELVSPTMKVVFQILSNATAMADPPPRGGVGGGIRDAVPVDIVPPPVPPGRIIRGRVIVPQPAPLPPPIPPRIIID